MKSARKWFPVERRLAMPAKVISLPIHAPIPGLPEDVPFAFFAPDERTLVVATEDEVIDLIDRLAASGTATAPPSGWEEVDRNLIGIAINAHGQPLVTGEWPRDSREVRRLRSVVEAVDSYAVGVTSGKKETVLRVILTGKNEGLARSAERSLGRLFAYGREADLTVDEGDGMAPVKEMARAFLTNARLSRVGPKIRLESHRAEERLESIRGDDSRGRLS